MQEKCYDTECYHIPNRFDKIGNKNTIKVIELIADLLNEVKKFMDKKLSSKEILNKSFNIDTYIVNCLKDFKRQNSNSFAKIIKLKQPHVKTLDETILDNQDKLNIPIHLGLGSY